jgi:sucrose phosphorylase
MLDKLRLLYGDQAGGVLSRIDQVADRFAKLRGRERGPQWDQRSVVLITYGDQVRGAGQAALEAQRQFLLDYELDTVISGIHILPFFSYSSDDGFSVIDYRHVDPNVGDWSDVDRLGESFGMAFDFVVNHCSQHNDWFQRYLKGEEPYVNYFIDIDPSTDLSAVTRPRSTPLLTPCETNRGTKHVWTTFSADQIDLNFGCPEVLLEALEILLLYIQHGATVIRLDAIGFLWKQIGTTCMHLPETHAVVKLMRDLVDDLAPGTVLLTETNVPHEENISYFGDGDEAHAVYQFSLAPLLLDAYLTGDARPLNGWLSGLEFPGEGMTYFNFTASHDGIGVRPLEGLVPQGRIDGLVEGVRQRGGLVNMRRNPDETDSPYELNITYVSALDSPTGLSPDVHARKFLASQGLMLALRGVPGIYFHSLVGTPNYADGVEQTGHNRTINRRKFDSDELRQILSKENSVQRKIFDGYRHLLAIRIAQPAFHPDAQQTVLETNHKSIVALLRTSLDGNQRILVLTNVGEEPVTVDSASFVGVEVKEDLLSGKLVENQKYVLAPHDIAWLA